MDRNDNGLYYSNYDDNMIDYDDSTIDNMGCTARSVIQLAIITNAVNMGWKVEMVDTNKYVLRKKIRKLNNNEKCTSTLLNMIFDIRK